MVCMRGGLREGFGRGARGHLEAKPRKGSAAPSSLRRKVGGGKNTDTPSAFIRNHGRKGLLRGD